MKLFAGQQAACDSSETVRLHLEEDERVREAADGETDAVHPPYSNSSDAPPDQEAFRVMVTLLSAVKLANERVTEAAPAGGVHFPPAAISLRMPCSVGSDVQSSG